MTLRHSSGLSGTKGKGPSAQNVDFLAVLTESKSASCIMHFSLAGHSQWKMSEQPQNFLVKTLLAACTHNNKEYVQSLYIAIYIYIYLFIFLRMLDFSLISNTSNVSSCTK